MQRKSIPCAVYIADIVFFCLTQHPTALMWSMNTLGTSQEALIITASIERRWKPEASRTKLHHWQTLYHHGAIATSNTPPHAPSMKSAEPTPLEAISHGPTLPGIPSFENLEEKRQWIKEHMAGVFRVFARLGYTEGMSGHISVLDPIQTDAMWMNPLGVRYTLVCSRRPT